MRLDGGWWLEEKGKDEELGKLKNKPSGNKKITQSDAGRLVFSEAALNNDMIQCKATNK